MDRPETYKLVYLARRAKGVSRVDWPRTWRSHAIFASQFPVLEAEIDWLRYCNRVDEPAIDGQPVRLPQLSSDHDGVAVAASGSTAPVYCVPSISPTSRSWRPSSIRAGIAAGPAPAPISSMSAA